MSEDILEINYGLVYIRMPIKNLESVEYVEKFLDFLGNYIRKRMEDQTDE